MIEKLLGHTRNQTTVRYAPLTEESVRESAAWTAAIIGAAILEHSQRHQFTLIPYSDL